MSWKLIGILLLTGLAVLLVLWLGVLPLISSELSGSTWQLQTVHDEAGALLWASVQPGQFTMQFNRTEIGGRGGCNSYGGSYEANRFTHTFSTDRIEGTLIGCQDQELQQHETEFFRALITATRYEREGDELRLYCENETRVLIFKVTNMDGLQPRVWKTTATGISHATR